MRAASQTLTQPPIDMQLLAQRISQLAEIAVLEHLETLRRTQADGLFALRAAAEDS